MVTAPLSRILVVLLILLAATGSGTVCLGDVCACGRCPGEEKVAVATEMQSCHGGAASPAHDADCLCLDAADVSTAPEVTLAAGPSAAIKALPSTALVCKVQAPTPVEAAITLCSQPPSPARLFSLTSSMLL